MNIFVLPFVTPCPGLWRELSGCEHNGAPWSQSQSTHLTHLGGTFVSNPGNSPVSENWIQCKINTSKKLPNTINHQTIKLVTKCKVWFLLRAELLRVISNSSYIILGVWCASPVIDNLWFVLRVYFEPKWDGEKQSVIVATIGAII